MTAEHLARRSDDGRFILCGRALDNGQPICDTKLAFITDVLGTDDTTYAYVAFWNGWHPEERSGTWALNKHARDKLRRGYPPTPRRAPRSSPYYALLGYRQPAYVKIPVFLPVAVECPRCALLQRIDPTVLGLARAYRPGVPSPPEGWPVELYEGLEIDAPPPY